MTILVTGGCGYLGSKLVRDLGEQTDADRIRILDNMQAGEHRALMELPGAIDYEFVEGDILDPSVLRLALRDVETVVHLAAIVHTPFSFQDPERVEQVNHWGTTHLIEACISNGVETLIYPSSSAVYGPGGPFSEDDGCRPNGAYAHSKLKAERAVSEGGRRGLRTAILRLGMMFGSAPVVRFDNVAHKFAKLVSVGRALTVYGDGAQSRPFVHVADASRAVCRAVRRSGEIDGETYNVVSENASVADLVETIREIRPGAEVRRTEQDMRTHFSLELDGSAIREAGWSPERTMESGLGELIERFRGFEPPPIEGAPEL